MTVKINYLKTTGKKANANMVLFVNEKFGTNNIKKYLKIILNSNPSNDVFEIISKSLNQ